MLEPMPSEKDIKILIADKCTRKEAISYLQRGSAVVEIYQDDDIKKWIDVFYGDEETDDYKNALFDNVLNGKDEFMSLVWYEGERYLISYVV